MFFFFKSHSSKSKVCTKFKKTPEDSIPVLKKLLVGSFIPFELIGGTPVDAYKGTPQTQSLFL